jgi:thiol-disulfide isomerase/thioredoxin
MKKWLSLLLVSLLISGCTTTVGSYSNKDIEALPLADMSSYTLLLAANHQYRQGDFKLLMEQYDKKTTLVVYLGFPGCPWCQEVVPVLDEVAKKYDVPMLAVTLTRESFDENYESFVASFNDYLADDGQGGKQLSVPLVLFIKEGKVLVDHLGSVKTHNAHERLMTKEEKESLTEIYDQAFRRLLAE